MKKYKCCNCGHIQDQQGKCRNDCGVTDFFIEFEEEEDKTKGSEVELVIEWGKCRNCGEELPEIKTTECPICGIPLQHSANVVALTNNTSSSIRAAH